MRRLFWVAVGATAGIVVAHKIRRTAQRISPPAVSTSVAQAFSGMRRDIRDFTKDVRFAMAEREAQLHGALGLAQATARDDEHLQLVHDARAPGVTRKEAS